MRRKERRVDQLDAERGFLWSGWEMSCDWKEPDNARQPEWIEKEQYDPWIGVTSVGNPLMSAWYCSWHETEPLAILLSSWMQNFFHSRLVWRIKNSPRSVVQRYAFMFCLQRVNLESVDSLLRRRRFRREMEMEPEVHCDQQSAEPP